jgi:2-iminobutanoate/2-iminopropanoate deaminase
VIQSKIGTCLIATLLITTFLWRCGEVKKEIIYTSLAPKPIGPYSQAVKCDGNLYVSGQIGLTAEGLLDTSSVEAEVKQLLNNIKAIVEAGGMQLSDVCKTTIYLQEMSLFNEVNEIYSRYFPNEPPARETIAVKSLPKGARVEISVMAKGSR